MNTFFKQFTRFLFIFLLLAISETTFSMIKVGSACPDKFVGTVKKVLHPEPLVHSSQWSEIYFEVTEKLTGTVSDAPKIKILRYGPNKFEEGEEYIVSLRNGFLCLAELRQ